MSSQLVHDCPHCLTRSAGFRIANQWKSNLGPQYSNMLAICGVCNLGVTLESYSKYIGQHIDFGHGNYVYDYGTHEIERMWPAYRSGAPEGVPDNVAAFYLQGLEGIMRRHWDAAGAMFRKTLDTATKILNPAYKTMSLYVRINKLVEDNVLTPGMGDWSHEIRLDGNSAVHDEDPETELDALTTQKFTEAFLTYAFSLPLLVSTSRAGRELTEAA